MPVCLFCSPHDNDKMILTIAVMPIDDLHKNAGQLAVDPQQLSKGEARFMSKTVSGRSGCLGLLLRIFGVAPSASAVTTFPFHLRDDFLSPAEISFYHVLLST